MANAPPKSSDDSPTPMHVVIAAPYVLWRWHFAVDLEIIENHLAAGDEVTVLGCQGQFEACDMNPKHRKWKCKRCRGGRMAALELLSGPVHVESIDQLTQQDLKRLEQIQTRFASIAELKAYKLDGFDVGMAALSSLVSLKRDPDVDLDANHDLLGQLLRTAWLSFRSMQNYLATHRVDVVYAFNGRYAPVRGILRACQQAGIECVMHERGHDVDHYEYFPNTLPHDQQLFQSRVRDAWQAATLDDNREKIATEWFERRAAGVAQSWKSYVTEQREDHLPADWDPDCHNIVFFSTSEDEFVAISDRWAHTIYPTQIDAIRAIVASIEDDPRDLHVYLRMHPNLATVENRQRYEMESLSSPHLTVIRPDDATSTYALVRNADKVLTAGSTVGIESVFWGTPSILIGPSAYQDLEATYNPKSHEELVPLLYENLKPKARTPALMFGYYCATYGIPFERFEADGFLDGKFKGTWLSKHRKGKFQVWLRDRPPMWRPKLSPLAPKRSDDESEDGRRAA